MIVKLKIGDRLQCSKKYYHSPYTDPNIYTIVDINVRNGTQRYVTDGGTIGEHNFIGDYYELINPKRKLRHPLP